jgi:chorismate-pyruvate lyase
MNIFSEDLLNRLLDAPVGKVITVLGEILNCNIKLNVIEQNSVSPNQFVRKVSITAKELPLIKANVRFDSTVLPEYIMADLLKKKHGIGDILTANGINATRNVIALNINTNENKVTREYEIIHNEIVWFTIVEEIRLVNFGSDNNS